MSDQELDLDTLSLADLRKLANEEVDKQVTTTTTDDTQQQTVVTPPTPQVYRREIDLGDGSGKEVFEATSPDALLDKIIEAKTHATRKIREQEVRIREFEQQKQAEAQQTDADKEFVYSQELMSQPTLAMKKMFKDMTGYDISEFRTVAERSKALEAAQAQAADTQTQDSASKAFMEAHPEYIGNPRNGQRLVKNVELLMHEARAAGQQIDYRAILEKAYEDLTESGLLELKAEDVTAGSTDSPRTDGTRIETPVEVGTAQRQPKRASSLSSRGRTVTTAVNTELSEEELEKMPLAKLRELANQSFKT